MPINHSFLEVEIQGVDSSIRCINGIKQVMDHFQFNGELSPNGKDFQAVYAWFVARYKPGISVPGLFESADT